jgi:hypothetical protein
MQGSRSAEDPTMKLLFAIMFACAMASVISPSQAANNAQPETATAQPSAIEDFTISRKGDLELSCTELYHEAVAMSLIIADTKRIKEQSDMQSRGVSAAGAVGSFLIGSMTGGIGLALGGFLLDQNIEDREENADKIQDIAEQRRTFMMGIYTAQGCEGDIYSMIEKEYPKDAEEISAIEPAASDEPKTQGIPENSYNN